MAWIIVLVVIGLPIVEIVLFIKSIQWIGFLTTLALAIGAGVAGMFLLRHQGLAVLWRTRAQLERGEFPLSEAIDGICLAAAGLLLVLPGFLTDVLAVLLLLPPVRALLKMWLAKRIHPVVVTGQAGPHPQAPPPVIEGEFKVVSKDDDKPA